jgi:hypothetical protein
MWEGFYTGHLNFELNCAGVYTELRGWISMKLET